MNKNFKSPLLISAAAISLICVGGLAYIHWDDISDILGSVQGGEMKTLVDLARAIRALDENVSKIENAANYGPVSADEIQSSDIQGQSKMGQSGLRFRELCQADSDVDFVFTKLDLVRGDMDVKQRRKELVEINKKLAVRIDALKREIVQ